MTANKFRIVSLATLFNLFFEYAVGGVERIFNKPMTIVFLALIYFSLFSMLEDLIRRFKLNNLQIAVFAIGFGIFPELYLTGSVFGKPLLLGINWQAFLTINIVWWGVLQSLVTLYFANRLSPREWSERYMGPFGWGACIVYIVAICAVSFVASPSLRKGPLEGYLVATLCQIGCAGYLAYSIPKPGREAYGFKPHMVLDVVAFGTVLVFVGIGTFVAGRGATLNAGMMLQGTALTDATLWSFVVMAGVALYYALTRGPISA